MSTILEGLSGAALAASLVSDVPPVANAINWELVTPIIVSVVTNAVILAYLIGGLRTKIDNLSSRIDKIEVENDRSKDLEHRLEERVHELALALARIEERITGMMDRVDKLCSEIAECPIGGHQARTKRKRKPEMVSDGLS